MDRGSNIWRRHRRSHTSSISQTSDKQEVSSLTTWSMLSGMNSPSLLMLVKEPFLATCCSASGMYPGGGELRSVEWEPEVQTDKYLYQYLPIDGNNHRMDPEPSYSPIKASMLFLSAALKPVLSSSSWDGRRSMLDEEFCQ